MMKIALIWLILVCGVTAAAQNERFRLVGKYVSDAPILAYQFYDNNTKLVIVNTATVQVYDLRTNQERTSIKHDAGETIWNYGGANLDFTKFIVFGLKIKRKGESSDKLPAAVYDVDTGSLLKSLESSQKVIKGALWSKNGKTLVTASDGRFTEGGRFDLDENPTNSLTFDLTNEIEICFWDGETLEKRAAITVSNVTWHFLSADGEHLLVASGPQRSVLGVKYASEKAAAINVYSTRDGRIEKQINANDAESLVKTRKINVAPNGATLALAVKSRSNQPDELRVYQIGDKGGAPQYSIAISPKIGNSAVGYSPDNKLVAVDAGRDTQVFDLATGAKQFEIANFNVPDFWLNNNRIALYQKLDKMRAVSLPDGKIIYEQPLYFRTETITKPSFSYKKEPETETIVVDSTRIAPRADGKMLLTYSNQAVTLIDAATGIEVQKLIVAPPVRERQTKVLGIFKAKIKEYGLPTVGFARWSTDGRRVVVMNAQRTALTVWEDGQKDE